MTGCIFDPAAFAPHNKPGHAEHQGRLAQLKVPDAWPRVPLRSASDQELLAVHTPDHLRRIAAITAVSGGMLDPDTYCTPDSESISRAAGGALVDLSLAVWRGEFANGLALMRPPGHHAESDRVMGFCLYNHVAVAAAALRKAGAARVAILDFDVHHGNGTQEIFYADPTVLFASSHQYPFYPGSGQADERGHGAGEGFTLNAPLEAGAGDAEFLAVWRDQLLPAVRDFAPQAILVSAGYDAHVADPLAGLQVTTEGFVELVAIILATAATTCGGKTVFTLEGGYDATALAACVAVTAAALDHAAGEAEKS